MRTHFLDVACHEADGPIVQPNLRPKSREAVDNESAWTLHFACHNIDVLLRLNIRKQPEITLDEVNIVVLEDDPPSNIADDD